MRIAFISANRERLPDACIPIGLLYVIAATPSHHETRLIDLVFAEDPLDKVSTELGEFSPDIVALGIRNLQNNDYSGISNNLEALETLVSHIRSLTNAPLILGGAGFSVMPDELMNLLDADFGIAGEGEQLFPLLLESIEFSQPPPKGVLVRGRERTCAISERRSFLPLDDLAPPDRNLLDRDYYALYGIDSVQTSRGCPLQCTYCTYPIIEGSTSRLRSPTRVADEFEQAREHGANHVFVVDSVFNLPRRHARSVCEELIRRRNEMPWTCYANPIHFDDDLASLMAQAGCVGIEVGADSGCNDILHSLRKGFTTCDISAIHEKAQRHGIADCHTFILGTEGETIDHVKRSLDFIVDLDPFAAIIMVWIDDHEAFEDTYREARRCFRASIFGLLEARKNEFARWIIPSIGVNFNERQLLKLRRAGMRGPLWQHMKDARVLRSNAPLGQTMASI